jgi:hypothetical protein
LQRPAQSYCWNCIISKPYLMMLGPLSSDDFF